MRNEKTELSDQTPPHFVGWMRMRLMKDGGEGRTTSLSYLHPSNSLIIICIKRLFTYLFILTILLQQ